MGAHKKPLAEIDTPRSSGAGHRSINPSEALPSVARVISFREDHPVGDSSARTSSKILSLVYSPLWPRLKARENWLLSSLSLYLALWRSLSLIYSFIASASFLVRSPARAAAASTYLVSATTVSGALISRSSLVLFFYSFRSCLFIYDGIFSFD